MGGGRATSDASRRRFLALDRKRRIDTAFEVYLGLYQAITGPEERQKLYREFSPGFFDLIVIDECHRGSAAADFGVAGNPRPFFRRDADRPHSHAEGNRSRKATPPVNLARTILATGTNSYQPCTASTSSSATSTISMPRMSRSMRIIRRIRHLSRSSVRAA